MAISEKLKKDVGVVFRGDGVVEFRVWAPFASAVSLTGDFNDWGELALAGEGDGYWAVRTELAVAGSKYKYVIYAAGGERLLRNDPRGLQITDSVNGVSVVPDPEFDWGDDKFVLPAQEDIVLYELHVGTFNRADKATTGTFYDAIEKLDYLRDLGVTAVELMPVMSMVPGSGGHGDDWGYEPNYIYAVEESYGGRRGLMEFVKACHACGMGVILDVVYNHFNGDYLWRFDGWSENDGGGIYFYNNDAGKTPWWGARPDYGRPEVRQYILDNAKMWMTDFRLDGLRVDSTSYIRNKHGTNDDPADDLPGAWQLMADVNALVHEINPAALTIAEDCSVNAFVTKPVDEGGAGFDVQWNLSLPHALRRVLAGEASGMDDVCYSLFERFNGDYMQKVVFADSHDTAANGGARIVEVGALRGGQENGVEERKVAILVSAVNLTIPGLPMLLQGQEFMQDGAFNGWQMLEWEKVERFAGVVQAVRDLIRLRRNRDGLSGGLVGGEIEVVFRDDVNRVLVWRRWSEVAGEVLVLVNFSDSDFDEYVVSGLPAGKWRVRFNSSWKGYSQDFSEADATEWDAGEDGIVNLELKGRMALVLGR